MPLATIFSPLALTNVTETSSRDDESNHDEVWNDLAGLVNDDDDDGTRIEPATDIFGPLLEVAQVRAAEHLTSVD